MEIIAMRILNPDYDLDTQLFVNDKSSFTIAPHDPDNIKQTQEEASAGIPEDNITISKEGLDELSKSPLWEEPPLRSIPSLSTPITHTTSNGNSFRFETIPDQKNGNLLLLTVTNKAGKETQFSIESDMIISEEENGELSINHFDGKGTDRNDIVVGFASSGRNMKDLKGGDDFILFLDDTTPSEKTPQSYDEATREQAQSIRTGDGNDSVYVANNDSGSLDSVYINTGSGDDEVAVLNDNKTSQYGYVTIETGSGNDKIATGSLQGARIFAGEGKDILGISSAENSLINAGSGNDSVYITNAVGSKITAGSGDDFLQFFNIRDSTITTGAGKKEISVLNNMQDVEFDCYKSEIKFEFQADLANNVSFLHLSNESARTLLTSLESAKDDAEVEIVLGKLENYNVNIGLNLVEPERFKNDIMMSEQLSIKASQPIQRYFKTL